jgi:hypothetical protein
MKAIHIIAILAAAVFATPLAVLALTALASLLE